MLKTSAMVNACSCSVIWSPLWTQTETSCSLHWLSNGNRWRDLLVAETILMLQFSQKGQKNVECYKILTVTATLQHCCTQKVVSSAFWLQHFTSCCVDHSDHPHSTVVLFVFSGLFKGRLPTVSCLLGSCSHLSTLPLQPEERSFLADWYWKSMTIWRAPPPQSPSNSVKDTCTVFCPQRSTLFGDRRRGGGGGVLNLTQFCPHILSAFLIKNTGTFFNTKRVDMPNFSRFGATWKIATK